MKTLTDVETLLMDLLRIDSVTGREAKIAKYIESKLGTDTNGFRLERQYVGKGRFNVVVRKGKSNVWMVAHVDTVPPFLPPRITKDKIFGRGAADNKGNIAGAIVAARQIDAINLLFTVGEEVDFVGVKKARAEDIVGARDNTIILEPTGFKKRFAQCGLVSIKLTTKGKQKHSSLLADDRESATHKLVNVLTSLKGKEWFCFNIGVVRGGVAENVVADFAEAEISIRPRDAAEFFNIFQTIRALNGVKVEVLNKLPPFTSGLLAAGDDGEPATFFSELSFFKRAVLFGAGNVEQAHTPDEYIRRKDLRQLPGELVKLTKLIMGV